MISRVTARSSRHIDLQLTHGPSGPAAAPARRTRRFESREAEPRSPVPMQPMAAGWWLGVMALPALLVWAGLLSAVI